jgi:mRNA interferase MazF
MRRGDVVIIAQKGVYEGKPRPAVIIQSESLLAEHPSILVCLLSASGEAASGAYYRIPVAPSPTNGLKVPSLILVDKISTIRRENVGHVIGTLDPMTIGRLNAALALFQGLI